MLKNSPEILLDEAWNEWSHGNITEAAKIWLNIKETLKDTKKELEISIDLNNYLFTTPFSSSYTWSYF